MENEKFQELLLDQFAKLFGKFEELNGKFDELRTELKDEIQEARTELTVDIQAVNDIQLRMENILTEKNKGLYEFVEVQRDANRDVIERLDRIEAKVEVLQLETAHIRRVKWWNVTLKELVDINASQRITIQMQQEKVNQLESGIASAVELEQKVSQMNQDYQMKVKQFESLEQESNSYKRQLELAQTSMEAQERNAIKATEQMVQVHKLELDKAILETEKKIKDDYIGKVETLTSKTPFVKRQVSPNILTSEHKKNVRSIVYERQGISMEKPH